MNLGMIQMISTSHFTKTQVDILFMLAQCNLMLIWLKTQKESWNSSCQQYFCMLLNNMKRLWLFILISNFSYANNLITINK